MLEPLRGALREAVSEEGGFGFVRRLLSPDPVGRPSAVKAFGDPWLKVSEARKVKGEGVCLQYHDTVL